MARFFPSRYPSAAFSCGTVLNWQVIGFVLGTINVLPQNAQEVDTFEISRYSISSFSVPKGFVSVSIVSFLEGLL